MQIILEALAIFAPSAAWPKEIRSLLVRLTYIWIKKQNRTRRLFAMWRIFTIRPTAPSQKIATLESFVGLATFKGAPRVSKTSANKGMNILSSACVNHLNRYKQKGFNSENLIRIE